MDKAQPSTNAVSASNLFRLGVLLDSEPYTLQAKETINAFEAEILQYPWLFVGLLISVVTARLGVKKVCVQRGDEKVLTEFYTSPRAEAKVLRLVEGKTGETDKGSSGREAVTGVVEGAAEELRSKVESMTVGSRP